MTDDHGATLLSWTFLEHEEHVRGRAWYTVTTVIALVLLAYAFVARNFLFAVIVVMFAVILYLRYTRAPERLTCTLTERGILLGERFLSYDTIREFWIVDRPEGTHAFYANPRGVRPPFAVPLDDVDTARVRTILREHVAESVEQDEPTSATIGRMLKL